jgi:benzoate/toluate 1,2-dioxygenase beta subunit
MALLATGKDEIQRFLYHEAWLLDNRRFEEWLQLFTEDAIYWIPNLREDSDPVEDGVIIYERKAEMKARVARLLHPAAYTQEPPPRTRHLITNLIIRQARDDTFCVTCNFVVYTSRGNLQAQFVGTCEYTLLRVDDQWRIQRKKIFLINNDQPVETLPIL